MDVIDPILSIASSIYSLCEQVKANKKSCHSIAQRVHALQDVVEAIRRSESAQACPVVGKSLRELHITLISAQDLIKKYTSDKFLMRMLKTFRHRDDFAEVNCRLTDNFQVLCGALQVDQRNKLGQVFDEVSRKAQDEVDRKQDDEELKKLLLGCIDQMEKIVENINKPSITSCGIREIKLDELEFSFPKKPFFTTSTSEVYKGKYCGFTVAIKKYTEPLSHTPSEVRSVFWSEVETMRRFESPNILRMFGICVREDKGPNPQFLLIMEYCEKGSLRQVLDSGCQLSWSTKACMCLDAAQGLYRLHHTEEKSKVHGCINSSKFLVAEGYRVKLGGLELAKTETSLKKKKPVKNKISSLCYISPQQLNDINYSYDKQCEMYSFGIVLWEIATCKKPFEGCSPLQIYQKVYEQRLQEEIPGCPADLEELINACRAFESFERPSAGVLVDKLRSVVEKLVEK
ncbi:mixed lineage kinase domain-like protein [Myripristis murdjan]|uniref:mixed lineage kinase domain-like protein n=1 Tax=Myripristis murdjan TaxID=586833 RepID=UPI001175DBEB|nr:mixed lineage kinase domain-like protein [Myripristis murdjan]